MRRRWRSQRKLSSMDDFRGAGGTEGGIGMFLIGFVMAVAGAYLLTSQVTVTSGAWHLWGYNAFGLSLLPFVVGIAFLFFNGKSPVGWVLTIAGAVILFVGIIANLEIYFRATSLFNTLIMLILLLGGIALVARSLRARVT
jgi:predicted membrane channel-forming protein YqfA (hemolysin III family)